MAEKIFRLPKAFAVKWIAELRSGKHQQGRCFLIDKYGRMCCLAVAGLVAGLKKKDITIESQWWNRAGSDLGADEQRLMPAPDAIPGELIGCEGLPKQLSKLNDGEGKATNFTVHEPMSFEQIADWIEQNVELYETPAP